MKEGRWKREAGSYYWAIILIVTIKSDQVFLKN